MGDEFSTRQCASKEASGFLLYVLRDSRGPFVVDGLYVDGSSLIVMILFHWLCSFSFVHFNLFFRYWLNIVRGCGEEEFEGSL